MDTKSNRSIDLNPQIDEQIEIVNMTLVHVLSGYNQNHPSTLEKNLVYIHNYYNIDICTLIVSPLLKLVLGISHHFL